MTFYRDRSEKIRIVCNIVRSYKEVSFYFVFIKDIQELVYILLISPIIKGKEYFYLVYRKNGVLKSQYLGGASSSKYKKYLFKLTAESGSYGTMDTAAVIVNSRTFAPIRYLAEYFGYAVGWDGATRTVSISGSSDPGPVSHGYVWVLKDTEYKLNDTDNEYSTIDYTYLGVVDGMVTFKRTGGYNHNGKYALCDGTYSCQEAPGTIPALPRGRRGSA